MTAQQVLIKLVNMGIVHQIGEQYTITTRAHQVLNDIDIKPSNSIELEPISKGTAKLMVYPAEIRNAAPKNRVTALLNYCKVPRLSEKGQYILRSETALVRARMKEIMQDQSIDVAVLLESITDYYQTMEYPKGFSRYVSEGDIITLYEWYKEGNKLTEGGTVPDNIRWE